MNLFKNLRHRFNNLIRIAKPVIHKHYENNFDFQKQYDNTEKLIRENEKLKMENESLLKKLKEAVNRNSKMEKQLDDYGTVLEILLTYVDDENERRKISNLLVRNK